MWKVTCNEFTKPNSLFPVGYYLSYCYKIITKSIFGGFGKGLYRDEVELISHFKSNRKSLTMKQDSVFLFSLLSLFLKIWSFVINKWPSQPNTALWNNLGERKQLCHFQQGKVIGNSFSSIFCHITSCYVTQCDITEGSLWVVFLSKDWVNNQSVVTCWSTWDY